MKKIIIAFIFTSLIMTTAFAAEETYCLEFSKVEGVKEEGMMAQFDSDGVLIYGTLVKIEQNGEVCSTEVTLPTDDKNIRLYFPDTNTTIKEFSKIEKKPSPAETIAPGEEPLEESRYPREVDEVTAFMMVKKVTTVVVEDEVKILFKVFFNGKEIEFYVEEDMTLASASLRNLTLAGKSVNELKKGDIIYCAADSHGNVYSIELIYRPIEEDISLSGENFGDNFETLFTLGTNVTTAYPVPYLAYGTDDFLKHQYVFGIIKDYKIGSYLTLCNKKGLYEEEIKLDIKDNVVVYVYDALKKDKIYIGSAEDIVKSYIHNTDMDQDDNVVAWTRNSVCNYALVRVGKGLALDVAIFINCNK